MSEIIKTIPELLSFEKEEVVNVDDQENMVTTTSFRIRFNFRNVAILWVIFQYPQMISLLRAFF